MDVAAQAARFPPHDQRDLAVRLVADQAVDDVHATLFERAGPEDVGLLVHPGFQFDQRGHLFAVFGRPLQRPDDR